MLSRHDSRAAPQTVQTASPVCGTKNFSSVRLYSAPQLHCTIVAIPGICASDRRFSSLETLPQSNCPLPTRELVGGLIGDFWRSRGGAPNLVFRTLFGIAALIATVSVFAVAYVRDPVIVVALLSTTLFFLRWCGMYWAIPSMLATRDRAGFLGGCMNLGGNIAGITVPIIVGFIVQLTGSYFLALMFFAAAGLALLACSTSIDYSRKLPV